jgi:tripartite-type tricarboxylate transporter receptor subunit TctC
MIVPYKPGGRSDILARVIGKYTRTYLGTELAVVNLDGASGTLGCREVLAAKPDGYTLLYHHQSMLTSYHTGLVDFNYNSFVPVVRMAKTDNVYLVKPDSPWNSFKDLAEAAKKKPGTIRVASSVGSPLHLSFVMMQRAANNAFQLAAGGGGDTDRITKLLGGHIEVTSASLQIGRASCRERVCQYV